MSVALEFRDETSGEGENTLEVEIDASGAFSFAIECPLAGDSPFGERCAFDMTRDQARKLRDWLGQRLAE